MESIQIFRAELETGKVTWKRVVDYYPENGSVALASYGIGQKSGYHQAGHVSFSAEEWKQINDNLAEARRQSGGA